MAHRQPSEYRFESEVQADILKEFGSGKPMRVWRNNVGEAYPIGPIKGIFKRISAAIRNVAELMKIMLDAKKLRPVKYSVVGSADILGILMGGRFLAIECKMPGKDLDPEQVKWRDMFVRFGGLYIVATCIEDVYRALEAEGVKCR